VPASVGGSEAKQERGEAHVDGKAVKSQGPDPRSDVEPLAGGGHTLDGMSTLSYLQLPLMMAISQNRVDTATVTAPNEIHSDGNTQSGAADQKKSNWKSTASSTAKLLLRGVRDSADAFGPLKSVAGGLCFILENCEVWLIAYIGMCETYRLPAYKGKWADNRIIGTPSQDTCWTAV